MSIMQKQVLTLQQKLSPQQIQMIKLLELPTMQLEQRIKREIEENIVLEEDEHASDEEPQQISVEEYLREDDTPSYKSRINNISKDDKPRQAPLAGGRTLQEYLVEQLGYRNLSEEEMRLAVYLV
ncbi:MAG: RNA polymerase sigma-54 factor, partial [Alistipes sp.]|nr:RNA polymerase sigma-54 factor [Alistipes sp.]